VEAESSHPGVVIAARDRKQLGNARKISVKGRVEASNLRNPGKCLAKTIDQRDFAREVCQIERLRSAKLGD
jgi:hypothetical protein